MKRDPDFTRADRMNEIMLGEVERLLSGEARSHLLREVRVTRTRLARDLGHLRVSYLLGPGQAESKVHQEALERAAGWVASTLYDLLHLRRRLEVAFSFDRDQARAERVRSLLAEVCPGPAPAAASADVTDNGPAPGVSEEVSPDPGAGSGTGPGGEG